VEGAQAEGGVDRPGERGEHVGAVGELPHTLAFLATINQAPVSPLGVSRFGQSGSLDEVYRYRGIDADSIVQAALDLTG
jgi:pyruvate dehydrogenase complex dehydrogenase (E1) component